MTPIEIKHAVRHIFDDRRYGRDNGLKIGFLEMIDDPGFVSWIAEHDPKDQDDVKAALREWQDDYYKAVETARRRNANVQD